MAYNIGPFLTLGRRPWPPEGWCWDGVRRFFCFFFLKKHVLVIWFHRDVQVYASFKMDGFRSKKLQEMIWDFEDIDLSFGRTFLQGD